jgi:hypothetical protein
MVNAQGRYQIISFKIPTPALISLTASQIHRALDPLISQHHKQMRVHPRRRFLRAVPGPAAGATSAGSVLLADLEELPQLGHGFLGVLDRVADGARVLIDLVVVAAVECLVAEEVDLVVLDAAGLGGLGLEVLQAVGLVPAGGEDVEGDLAADGEAVCVCVSAVLSSWRKDIS